MAFNHLIVYMRLYFLFTSAQLPVTTLQVAWKWLPFFIAFLLNLVWLSNALFISMVQNMPIRLAVLSALINYRITILIVFFILVLGIAFLYGKMHKRSHHIARKKTIPLIITHVVVLMPVYLICLFISQSHKNAALFILELTLYIGMSRVMIAKNVLFIVQIFDGQNTFYY